MLILVVAVVAVLFSIIGHDMYAEYRANELIPKAEIISQQVSKLSEEHADRRTIARMIYSNEYSVTDTATYVVDTLGGFVTTDGIDDSAECMPTLLSYAEKIMDGETVKIPNSKLGVIVGVPIYEKSGGIIGAVLLLQRHISLQEHVNSLALTFGLVLLGVLLLTLIPSFLVVRSLTKPIRNISDSALKMAKGDLSVRAEVSGSFEAQHLAESFNVLAGALESNIEDLIVERNRLSAVLNGIGEGIIAVDRQGEITHFNPSSVHLLGGEGGKPSDYPNYSIVSELINKSIATDSPAGTTFGIADRRISVAVKPIYEDSGSLYGAVALMRDVTESERLEQTRRDYVANVSHELRTPIASIRGLAEALDDGMVTEPADRKRYYGYILHESMRLSSLIDDLLELSRLQSGGVAFSKLKTELYEILYDVADRMNESAQPRGKTVALNVPEGEYMALTNADRFEQVLIALTDNAIKHGDDGCEVTIDMGISEGGESYILTVSNPAEVDEKDLEHIFERFYKADKAHTGEGTGLGLAIVSEVLNLLGEKIRVTCENGMIRFSFTVKRDAAGGEPELPVLPAL